MEIQMFTQTPPLEVSRSSETGSAPSPAALLYLARASGGRRAQVRRRG